MACRSDPVDSVDLAAVREIVLDRSRSLSERLVEIGVLLGLSASEVAEACGLSAAVAAPKRFILGDGGGKTMQAVDGLKTAETPQAAPKPAKSRRRDDSRDRRTHEYVRMWCAAYHEACGAPYRVLPQDLGPLRAMAQRVTADDYRRALDAFVSASRRGPVGQPWEIRVLIESPSPAKLARALNLLLTGAGQSPADDAAKWEVRTL